MSYIVVDRETGKAVLELYDIKNVQRVNRAKYAVMPVLEYLGTLNKRILAENKQAC